LKLLALLGDEQFGITDNVDEENVPDLQLDLFFNLSGHINAPTERTRMTYNLDSTADSREQSPPSRNRRASSLSYIFGHQFALQTLATMCVADEVKVGCGKKRKWLLFNPTRLQKVA
jgi:hypothetical protein